MVAEHSSESSATALSLAAYSSQQRSAVWKYVRVELLRGANMLLVNFVLRNKVAHGGGTTTLRNHVISKLLSLPCFIATGTGFI